jgi:dTDP-L-rhamnose 4-epimerase
VRVLITGRAGFIGSHTVDTLLAGGHDVRVLDTLEPPVIYEDGEQLRDYVSIHDVVEANILVLQDSRADYQTFNVGGDRRVTVRELAQLVIETAGVAIKPELPGIYRIGDTRHSFSDVSKLQTLGWVPRVARSEMVREYLGWAAEQPDLRDTFAEAQARMEAAGVLRRVGGRVRISDIS